jgi:hypothetical protein
MSAKTLIIAAAVMTAGAMTTLPAAAVEGDTDTQAETRALPMRAQILFNLVDVNGDGAIDQTEIVALQRAIFTSIDTDGDGKVTEQEFANIAAGHRGMRQARMGMMGPGDEQGPGFHRGRHGDDDGDRHGPRHGRGPGGQQGQMQPHDFNQGPQGPGQGFGPGGMMQMPQFGGAEGGAPGLFGGEVRDFASLDADGDGTVSIEEFAAASPRLPLAAE